MKTPLRQFAVSRVFNAPRAMVYQAFTDPNQLATWWGPSGNSLPIEDIVFDVRSGGFQRWIEVAAEQPDVRVHVSIDLDEVNEGRLLTGILHVSGRLPGGFEPYETPFRIEFHDEPDGRSRLEIQQWLPAHLIRPTDQGWSEAFEKLDASLARLLEMMTSSGN